MENGRPQGITKMYFPERMKFKITNSKNYTMIPKGPCVFFGNVADAAANG